MKAGQGIPEIPPRRALPRLGQFLARRRARPPITPHEPRTIPLGTCQASCRTPRSEDRMASLATTIRAVRGPADGRRGARAKAPRVGARRSALSRFMRFIRTPRGHPAGKDHKERTLVSGQWRVCSCRRVASGLPWRRLRISTARCVLIILTAALPRGGLGAAPRLELNAGSALRRPGHAAPRPNAASAYGRSDAGNGARPCLWAGH